MLAASSIFDADPPAESADQVIVQSDRDFLVRREHEWKRALTRRSLATRPSVIREIEGRVEWEERESRQDHACELDRPKSDILD
jgi:hypothetical protein